MSDPAWQPYAYLAPATFEYASGPNYQQVICTGGTGQIMCPQVFPGPSTYCEILLNTGGYGVAPMALGLCNEAYAGANIRTALGTGTGFFCLDESGNAWLSGTELGNIGSTITTGTRVRVFQYSGGGLAFSVLTTGGWNPWAAGGPFTDAQVSAGTGLITAGLTNPVAFFAVDGSGSQTVSIYASTANCTGTQPPASAFLPANTALSITAVGCQESFAALISWAAGNRNTTGGLEYSVDGGAWNGCTGATTGASGTAIGSAINDYYTHTVALRETAAILDQTAPSQFVAHVPGTLLAVGSADLPNESSAVFSFSELNAGTVSFAGVISATVTSGLSGVTIISLTTDAEGTTDAWSMGGVTGGGNTTITATGAESFAVVPGVDTTTPVTGTLAVTSAGTFAFDISCNGTVATGSTLMPTPEDTGFSAIKFLTTGAEFNDLFGASAAVPPPAETLTLTSVACCAGETLDIGATVSGTPPEGIDIGVNGTYAAATSFTLTGDNIAATDGVLSAGTYTITIRDTSFPEIVSNSLPLAISGESLTLTSLSGSFGTVLIADGLSNGGPPANVDISTDGGSTWTEATSFTNTGMGSVNNPFIAMGGTISTAGTLDVRVRDHTFPDCVISNALTLVAGEESILLTVASGSLGSTLSLAGTLYEAFPAALDVTLDDGSTWQDVSSYTHGATLPAAFLSSLTTSLAVGTYTVAVRDAVFTDIVSNYLQLIIAEGAAACPIPAAQPNLGRYRGAVGINWNGMTLIGDAFSGIVGQADFDNFTEYGNAMLGLITTPPLNDDRLRVFVSRFELDVESGIGAPDCCGANPNWMLDWSKDGGRTFGPQQILRSAGRIGAYLQRLRWLRLGQARQWIFRLQCTDPVRRVIIGVSVDTHSGMR